MKRKLLIAWTIVGLSAAGCGGSTTQSIVPNQSQPVLANTAQAQFSIVVPARSASASQRQPEYVSAATESVSFQVPGMASAQVVALTLGSGNCPEDTGGGYTCTASFLAPIGNNQTVTIKTYGSANGTGTPLSQNTATINVAATGNNPVTVALNGVATSIALALSPNVVAQGTAATIVATATAHDASGYTIVGPGTVTDVNGVALGTPTLTSSDTTHFSIGTFNSTGGTFSISYNGGTYTSPVTFTLALSGFTNATAMLTDGSATATPSPVPSGDATAFPTPNATPNLTESCDTSSQRCGVQRWRTKTLDDVNENLINWVPQLMTVTQLNNLPVPTGYNENGPGGSDDGRYAPYENQVYTVQALLVTRKHETGSSGDDDYHVEIRDPNNPNATMVTEAPHGECTYACASGFGSDFDSVRNLLDTCFGAATSSFQAFPAGVIVNLTGVGFFDGLHGQTGALANPSTGAASNFEIHPIVYMEFVSGKPVGVPGC
jgi:hypothetical protein